MIEGPDAPHTAKRDINAELATSEMSATLVSTDIVASLPCSELAQMVLRMAMKLARKHGGAPLTTLFLFAAMVEQGRIGLDTSLVLLHKKLAAMDPDVQETINSYLQIYGEQIRIYREQTQNSEEYDANHWMTPYMAEVLERAHSIAVSTSVTHELGARHLLGALLEHALLPKSPVSGARALLDYFRISADDLLQALLEYLRRNQPIGRPADNLDAWRIALSPNSAAVSNKSTAAKRVGEEHPPNEVFTQEPTSESSFTLGWQRDATETQTALNVEEVASALATTLDSTDGEVCFGLFGHWGRGKTHLMRRVTQLMPKRYDVVWFSAWKYPHIPRVWVHLYETLAEHAYRCALVPRLVRANLYRRGLWPLLGQLTLAGLFMIPLSQWLALLWTLLTMLGLWGGLSVVRVARAVISPARRLEATYLSQVSHADKLGLQETIGKDLRALLAGWLRWKRSLWFTIKHALVYTLALGLVAAGLHAGLSNLRASTPLQPWMAVALWLTLGVAAALWIWLYGRSTQRLLLIVDDLDRCEPAHMCMVIESLKLLVEDHKLEGRVQVVAVVEEDTLRWAIERRFLDRVTDMPETMRARVLDRLVAEHLQKLFIGHMRLPPLGHDELEQVLDKYLDNQPYPSKFTPRNSGFRSHLVESVPTTQTPLHAAMETAQASAGTTELAPQQQQQTTTSKEELSVDGMNVLEVSRTTPHMATDTRLGAVMPLAELAQTGASFSEEECQALKQALPVIIEQEHAQSGPRSLRSFLLQYQLARLLLLAHGHTRLPPRVLIHALLHASSDNALSPGEQKTLRTVIAIVQPWTTTADPT